MFTLFRRLSSLQSHPKMQQRRTNTHLYGVVALGMWLLKRTSQVCFGFLCFGFFNDFCKCFWLVHCKVGEHFAVKFDFFFIEQVNQT